ncbi:hypothetical protein [Streptomyces rimosus]|uniref:hypothetical protein n=1 Tax=Streptomyces rimosus TaxID=1927 RepID=UPI001F3FA235|nr:hypothetical protein [Streptomyces rimosus]
MTPHPGGPILYREGDHPATVGRATAPSWAAFLRRLRPQTRLTLPHHHMHATPKEPPCRPPGRSRRTAHTPRTTA